MQSAHTNNPIQGSDAHLDELASRLRQMRGGKKTQKKRAGSGSEMAMHDLMQRIKFHYGLRLQATDLLKNIVMGFEPSNSFQHEYAEHVVAQSQFNERTLNQEPYRKSPDQHDDALALVLWDLFTLPRELSLQRMGISTTDSMMT